MRIGLNFTPPHESPEQWAEILEDCGRLFPGGLPCACRLD